MRGEEAKIKTGQKTNPPLPPFGKGWIAVFFFFLLLCSFAFSSLAADPKKMGGDGHVVIYNYQTGEAGEATYRVKYGYDKTALQKIYAILKSPDDKVTKIPLELIELLDDIQDHFNAETIEIISAYRSPEYNKNLRLNGRVVARESLHTKGMAADIHLDEISEEALRDYAVSLKRGGVGFYPAYNFVHVDLGSVRTWGEKGPQERVLAGTSANPNEAWRILTDKNQYRQGEPVKVTATNVCYEKTKLATNIWYEHFRKGAWEEHELLEKKSKTHVLKPQQSVDYNLDMSNFTYGKYRLVFFTSKDFSASPAYSNEFYIKKE